ncbi:MAG: hypothetical protein COT17_07550 [Elusimicrobia bacterium CG08_land_8_20_14_0_20_51_18]|nr:MAG: hypothetical protein COT17_07550 [Elusimicrobia bacterium CG08_land_8_20_14_0_20_51_18]
MKKKIFKSKKLIIAAVIILLVGGGCAKMKQVRAKKETERIKALVPVHPVKGRFVTKTQATGAVEPENRVLVTPSLNGRAEEILFREGDAVLNGQILAWISSSERTALLDSLKSKDGESAERKMVEEAYNLTPVVSPIAGSVVKRAAEPGQSVNSAKEIAVISDRLIIKTLVDETDIGKVKEGQQAEYYLDAFPEEKKTGEVLSIAHESSLKEGVNVYEVKILPHGGVSNLRSGMTADVRIITGIKSSALYLPKRAVSYRGSDSFVSLKENGKLKERKIKTGASNEMNLEILSGVTGKDTVYYSTGIAAERMDIIIGGR